MAKTARVLNITDALSRRRASLLAAAVRGTANVLTLIAYLLAALVFVLPWIVLMAWSLVYLTHLLIGRD
jgi:hypothetical protein